jgi:hypothetical protein
VPKLGQCRRNPLDPYWVSDAPSRLKRSSRQQVENISDFIVDVDKVDDPDGFVNQPKIEANFGLCSDETCLDDWIIRQALPRPVFNREVLNRSKVSPQSVNKPGNGIPASSIPLQQKRCRAGKQDGHEGGG